MRRPHLRLCKSWGHILVEIYTFKARYQYNLLFYSAWGKNICRNWFCFAQKQGNEVQASNTAFVLCSREKLSWFPQIFCSMQCIIAYYIDMWLYMCKFSPENVPKTCTIPNEGLPQINLILRFLHMWTTLCNRYK